MKLTTTAFSDGAPIPAEYALGRPDPESHVTFSGNRNPDLQWSDLPTGTRSLVLICADPDAPTVPDDVNREGRVVPADLPRAVFHHWALVDLPPAPASIAAGEFSEGVTVGGKRAAEGPRGTRQGVNDYTGWFADDPQMRGDYYGYDGPCPPWNDARVHRYVFTLYALDAERCPVEGRFTAADVLKAIQGHVLGQASVTGTYTLRT